jgi:hypothetical protein
MVICVMVIMVERERERERERECKPLKNDSKDKLVFYGLMNKEGVSVKMTRL